jgi:2-beta-glucuronyltransferase
MTSSSQPATIPPPAGRVVLFTGHYHASRRRAGFHWLAKAFHDLGWDVTFATVSFSPLSDLAKDFRSQLIPRGEHNRLVEVKPRFSSFVWRTPFHPVHMRSDLLNHLTNPFFGLYGRLPLGAITDNVRAADLIIFESDASLMLVPRIRRLNSRARLVYRMSDDLTMLRGHPAIYAAEQANVGLFDLISVPSWSLWNNKKSYPRITWHSHGIEKAIFDHQHTSPYAPGTRNAIFVGVSHLDGNAVDVAAAQFPDWRFHVIGPLPYRSTAPNVTVYGEMAFEDTIPYIQHADIGLGTRSYVPGAEALSDSLKILQYTYTGLPILAPDFLINNLECLVPYKPGDAASIKTAFEQAAGYDRSRIRRDMVSSWRDLAQTLAGNRQP